MPLPAAKDTRIKLRQELRYAAVRLWLGCAGLALLTWVAVAADFSHTATFALLFMIVIALVSTTANSAAGIGLVDSSAPA